LKLLKSLRTWRAFKSTGGIFRICFDPLPGGGWGSTSQRLMRPSLWPNCFVSILHISVFGFVRRCHRLLSRASLCGASCHGPALQPCAEYTRPSLMSDGVSVASKDAMYLLLSGSINGEFRQGWGLKVIV